MLKGYKTYIAAAGLVCLAVYQATTGDFNTALQTFLGALAAFGIRNAIN